jgi:O-antigen/teichoic acid export membrane protein
MTISSVSALLAFADLGIGNGLLNAIAVCKGRDDRVAARRYVSSAFFLLCGVALVLGGLFAGMYGVVDWGVAFNVTTTLARNEAGPAVAIFAICLCINLPLDTVQRVQQGYQEGFVSHAWIIAGNLLALASLLLVIHLHGGLPWLVLALAGAPLLAVFVNWVYVFGVRRRWLTPSPRAFSWRTAREVGGSGVVFFVLTVLSLFAWSSDSLIIAHVVGVAAVADYAVAQKLFLTALISQYFITPLWPAFGEALARQDMGWARRTLERALIISFVLGLLTVIPLVAFGNPIIRWWVGPRLNPSLSMLVALAAWLLMFGYLSVMSSFLNSGALLARQLPFFVLAAVSSIVLKIFLGRILGVPGVVWGTVIGFGLFYAIPAGRLAFGYLDSPHSATSKTPMSDVL